MELGIASTRKERPRRSRGRGRRDVIEPRSGGLARSGAHRRHILAIGPVDSWRLASSQSTHQRELTAVMDAVHDGHAPQDVADRERAHEELNGPIAIVLL